MRKTHPLAVLLLIVLLPGTAAGQQDVTYLLPAPPFLPAFGPWMMAQHKGYYEAEGLNVTFQTAKGGVDVAKQVGVGNAVIGGGIGDTPILVRPNGVPVKAVAVLGGGSLMMLAARADAGVESPADLKGKTVTTMSYQDTTFYALLGMLAKVGLSRNDLDIQAAGPANTWKLVIANEAAAMAAVPDWVGAVRGAGVELKLWPADEYFRSMAQAILVSDQVIEENPELVHKLVRATLKGLQDIMADPQAAAAEYVQAVPQHAGKEAAMAAVFELYNQYVYPGQQTLGEMDPERLEALQRFYLEQGVIREATPLADLYSNDFIR